MDIVVIMIFVVSEILIFVHLFSLAVVLAGKQGATGKRESYSNEAGCSHCLPFGIYHAHNLASVQLGYGFLIDSFGGINAHGHVEDAVAIGTPHLNLEQRH
jgi:hypothetical protein